MHTLVEISVATCGRFNLFKAIVRIFILQTGPSFLLGVERIFKLVVRQLIVICDLVLVVIVRLEKLGAVVKDPEDVYENQSNSSSLLTHQEKQSHNNFDWLYYVVYK